MDAQQALADLTEISAQIEAAVIAERSGTVIASTLTDGERAKQFARAAIDLLEAARSAPGAEGGDPVQLEAALEDGSVFVVPEADRVIAAATRPEPTVGLVFYDLKSALRSSAPAADEEEEPAPAAEEKPKPKPRSRAKKADDAPAADKPKPKRAPRKKKDDGAA
jgi:predicted regulator of Ras-like GTPase activity (Roadblock/LC7/MglB family)